MRFVEYLTHLQGWKRRSACFLAGAAVTLALPPFFLIPAGIAGFSLFYFWLRHAPGGKAAFGAGWWFGFGHFTTGLYWFAHALLVDAAQFAWLIPFALTLIPAALAFYTALAAVLWHRLARDKSGFSALVLFASLWVLAEWLRGQLFTGFPWNLSGYMWNFSPEIMQLAALAGIWGLSFFAVLACCVFGVARQRPVGAVCALSLLLWCGGAWRLMEAQDDRVPGITLHLVQASIPQALKWDERAKITHIRTQMEMTRQSLEQHPDGRPVVVWPETAVPFMLEEASPLARDLAALLPPEGVLATGALRSQGTWPEWQVWNSVFFLTADARFAAVYDKHHLVPFGEYIPLRGVLPVEKITPGTTDFSRGAGPATLSAAGLPPVSPQLCYEDIFPAEAVENSGGAAWMLNLTNDGWFGDSTGPHQHFEMARLRAVEQGISMVRAANTGISGVVDPYGRVQARLELNAKGVVVNQLPLALPSPPPYARYGDNIMFIFIGVAAIAFILSRNGKI